MKLGLITPKGVFLSKNKKFQDFYNSSEFIQMYNQRWSGIGTALLILAALTPERYDISIIDGSIDEIPYEENFDIIGITYMTQNAVSAYEISDKFRAKGTKVILGGIHATILSEEAALHADSVVIGEADDIWPLLISDFEKGNLRKFYKSDQPCNLRKSPIPRYDLIKDKNYSSIWIQTSRGCPHDCEFCSASKIFGKKYRLKKLDNVLKEIELIKKYFPNSWIIFGDDNLLSNRKRAKEFLTAVKDYNIRWSAQSDISIGNDLELLRRLRTSGCSFVFVGLESLSEETLENIDLHNWKKKQRSNYEKLINNIQTSGIGVMGSFILGFDNDTLETPDNIKNFIIENNLYEAHITILTPLPGTRLWEKLDKQNRIKKGPWSNFTFHDCNINHPLYSKNELEDALLYIYKSINTKEVQGKRLEHFKNIQKKLFKTDMGFNLSE